MIMLWQPLRHLLQDGGLSNYFSFDNDITPLFEI